MNADAARDAIGRALHDELFRNATEGGFADPTFPTWEERPPTARAYWDRMAGAVLDALRALPDQDFQRIRTPGYTQPSPNCPACSHPWEDHTEFGCMTGEDDKALCPCQAPRPPR